jgi:hypothetical protein
MIRMLIVAATAAALLAGASCNSNAGSILPTTVGSTWHTESSTLEGTTTAALDTIETAVTTTTVSEKANLTNGKEVVKFTSETTVHQRTPDSTYTTSSYWWLREEAGVIRFYAALDDTVGDTVMMSEPAVGQSWNMEVGTSMVVGQEDVTVPAGTYKKAWKVKTVMNLGIITVDVYSWYARGVGNVKNHQETEYQSQSQVYDEELTSATIK